MYSTSMLHLDLHITHTIFCKYHFYTIILTFAEDKFGRLQDFI